MPKGAFPLAEESSIPMPFPNDSQDRTRLAGAGMRAFGRLSELWGLTPVEQATLLGAASPERCSAWLDGDVEDASEELLYRLSYVLAIYRRCRCWGQTPMAGGGGSVERTCPPCSTADHHWIGCSAVLSETSPRYVSIWTLSSNGDSGTAIHRRMATTDVRPALR